jgi:class 3 adenylate cyclase
MAAAVERHDELVRSAVEGHGGYVFSTGGDGFGAAFARAGEAVGAAVAAQVALAGEAWPTGAVIRVRMGLHTGEADERRGIISVRR